MKCPECGEKMLFHYEAVNGVCRFCGPGSAKAQGNAYKPPVIGNSRVEVLGQTLTDEQLRQAREERGIIEETAKPVLTDPRGSVKQVPTFSLSEEEMKMVEEYRKEKGGLKKDLNCAACTADSIGGDYDKNVLRHSCNGQAEKGA